MWCLKAVLSATTQLTNDHHAIFGKKITLITSNLFAKIHKNTWIISMNNNECKQDSEQQLWKVGNSSHHSEALAEEYDVILK